MYTGSEGAIHQRGEGLPRPAPGHRRSGGDQEGLNSSMYVCGVAQFCLTSVDLSTTVASSSPSSMSKPHIF